MDITLEIMKVAHGDYEKGDIVDGWKATDHAEWDDVEGEYHIVGGVYSPNTGYVHITGVPISVVQKIKILIEMQWKTPTIPEDPHSGGIEKKRKWHALIDAIPAGVKQKFNSNGEITFSWTTVKNFIHNKVLDKLLEASDLA